MNIYRERLDLVLSDGLGLGLSSPLMDVPDTRTPTIFFRNTRFFLKNINRLLYS